MGLESKEIEKYSLEKISRFSNILNSFRLEVYHRSPEDSERLYEEILKFDENLKKKYNVMQYAMIHALRGSSINPNRQTDILYDDFPGHDSVEKFINVLVEKYKL